jgi:hypothetical protein
MSDVTVPPLSYQCFRCAAITTRAASLEIRGSEPKPAINHHRLCGRCEGELKLWLRTRPATK